MPAPARYPPAHVQMFDLAIQARREGLGFEEFWSRARRPGAHAVMTVQTRRPCPSCEVPQPMSRTQCTCGFVFPPVRCVLFPTDTGDRRASVAALDATKEGWRRAYEREPPLKREAAVRRLEPLFRGLMGEKPLGSFDPAAFDPPGGIEPRAAVA